MRALIDLRSCYSHDFLAADVAKLLLNPASSSRQVPNVHSPLDAPDLQPYCRIFFADTPPAEQQRSSWLDPGCALPASPLPALPYALLKEGRHAVELIKRLAWIVHNTNPASLLNDWQSRSHQLFVPCGSLLRTDPVDPQSAAEQPGTPRLAQALAGAEGLLMADQNAIDAESRPQFTFLSHLSSFSHARTSVLVDAVTGCRPDSSPVSQAMLAIAMASIPVVDWAPAASGLNYFCDGSFLNIHGLDTADAVQLIENFSPTLHHAEALLSACSFNLNLLASFKVQAQSKRRLARSLWNQCQPAPSSTGC